jgi:glutathione S-transferase
MERVLADRRWLVGDRFTLADAALAPYLNRLAVLSLEAVWESGRLPAVAAWFQRIRERPAFAAAFVRWLPAGLAAEMRANGRAAWPELQAMLSL